MEQKNRQTELLIRKSALQRELENRTRLESGVCGPDDSPVIPRTKQLIEADLKRVNDEITDIENALSGKTGAGLTRGKLKEIVQKWAESSSFVIGESVPSTKISKFVNEHKIDFPAMSDGAVRSTLSRLGYSEEKDNSET